MLSVKCQTSGQHGLQNCLHNCSFYLQSLANWYSSMYRCLIWIVNRPEGSLSPVRSGTKVTEDLMATQDASFDPDKCLCCKVESGHTLVHGTGGRGYGLGATCISSGCYQWKVSSVINKSAENEQKSNILSPHLTDKKFCEICYLYAGFPCFILRFQFLIVKENKGNEGTCVGVSRFPVKDYSHRTTGDMWLYR